MSRLYAGLILLSGLVVILSLACAEAGSPRTVTSTPVAESTPASSPTVPGMPTPAPVAESTPASGPTVPGMPTPAPVAESTPASGPTVPGMSTPEPAPGRPVAGQPATSESTQDRPAPTRVQSEPHTTETQSPTETSDCLGPDGIREIRAAYAANNVRAEDTYLGERMCLRGAISGFQDEDAVSTVFATVSEEVGIYIMQRNPNSYLRHSRVTDEDRANWPGWRDWMLSSNVGDSIEAECRLGEFAPTKLYPNRERGTPIFTDCHRVVDGVRWTPPTATPLPTPTRLPCVSVDFGDPFHQWLKVDCPAGKVVVGQGNYDDTHGDFRFYSDGDSAVISFYFSYPSGSYSEESLDHHASWRRWTEPGQEGRVAKELWEAPPK